MPIFDRDSRLGQILVQFCRYVVVGGMAFFVDFGLFYLLLRVTSRHYLVAATLAYLAGLLVNYLLSIVWVFEYRRFRHRGYEFFVFAAIGVLGVGLNAVLISYISASFHVTYLLSKLWAALFILLCNFSARKFLLFTMPPGNIAGKEGA